MRSVFYTVLVVLLLAISQSVVAYASKHEAKLLCSAVPHNDKSIPAKITPALMGFSHMGLGGASSGLTELHFFNTLSVLENYYKNHFSRKGQQLLFKGYWESPRVNAFATLDDNDNPVIEVHGGLARHPMMTQDAFLMFLCHEMGHFLGGAPKIPRGNSGKYSWSSAEGAADYFASTKCLKALFDDDKKNQEVVASIPAAERDDIRVGCGEDARCIRIVYAGKVAARVIAEITGRSLVIHVSTPDPFVADGIEYKHPRPQCRLDTFVAGANCGVSPFASFDDHDPNVAACAEQNGDERGLRPKCWFNPSAKR